MEKLEASNLDSRWTSSKGSIGYSALGGSDVIGTSQSRDFDKSVFLLTEVHRTLLDWE